MITAIQATVLFLLLAPFQQDFTRFTYCRDNTSGSFEKLCIELNPAGEGAARLKRSEGDEIKVAISLSAAGKTQFLSLLSGTKYLANAKAYESSRKVADLGMKYLTLETPAGVREAKFNYSDMKDVNALVTFFDSLVTQEVIAIDLEWAMQFDSLGIPDRLDHLENVLKQTHLADPKSMVEVLGMIEQNEHIVNYARAHARQLSEKISAGK
jgi:hypothetical protein